MTGLQSTAQTALRTVVTLGAALLIGALIIQLSGQDALQAYSVLFNSAFGSERAIANTLLAATPLIFTGLATMVAFRAGIFNVGVEGSLYLGAFAAAWVGFTFLELPTIAVIPLAFLCAGLVGGLWALIPGYLKARLRVDEIVTTIMLNYVAILFTTYLVNGPFYLPGMANAMTAPVSSAAELPRLIERSQLNLAFPIAMAAFVTIALLLARTTAGYEIQQVGANRTFSRWMGMSVSRVILLVMFISGFLGGFAGAGQALGVHYRFIAGFSRGLGFDGIVVALLGRNNPIGVVLAAIFFGALRSGASTMEMFTQTPRDVIDVVFALIILFVSIDVSFDWWRRRKRLQQAQRAALVEG